MITWKRGPFRLGEVWFDQEPEGAVDVLHHLQRSTPLAGARCSDFLTIAIDLRKSREDLLADMKKGNQYQIRRAGNKDELVYRSHAAPTPETLVVFIDFYNAFAEHKKLERLGGRALKAYAAAGILDLSEVSDRQGSALVWHAHLRSSGRARLLYSASLYRESSDSAYRNRVGRANRFHHWQDMLRFKEEGISTYDLGGWYHGGEDQERLLINHFKEEFGGSVIRQYNCRQVMSLKGRLFLTARALLQRGRG